ncbi:potassium channel family protein [Naumannella halotolerans]|uniref:Voltage-gated potassium channel n=1 Tax=Naumannella halotolerans TaxID=993414 RepID=A0A4R7J8A4_9ACTN|nr:potassium channel family protein [Naumannella halotolerans]TDT33504.1 voltage-gated potassium channel [Naumannella halotolerans]
MGVVAGRKGDWRSERILVNLPFRDASPLRQLLVRGLIALGLLTVSTLLVWFDRDAYTDNYDGTVTLIDAIYYSTVTVTTTGYGDITPIAPHSRLINAIVITPLRIAFLVLLVGTTLEVLANQGRRIWIDSHWRKNMRNHTVVVGYGTKGRSAVATLKRHESDLGKVVVIDSNPVGIEDAAYDGVASIHGDGTRRDVLRRAEISKAKEVIITLNRDDAAMLCTLTVRQLNPSAHVVVAVREQENGSLLRQSGADSVVTSSDAVGRLLGLSAVSPDIGTTIEDLLASGEGLEVAERQVRPDEVGRSPLEVNGEQVLGVVRNKTLRRFYDPSVKQLSTGDQLIVVRRSEADAARQRAAGSPAMREGHQRSELD